MGKLNSGEILHLFSTYRNERRMYMDVSLLLEYGWVLLILIALEGILAADNALVLAIMVKHLPEENVKSIILRISGSICFPIGSLFMISFLVDVWQVQAIGAIYLMFIAGNHLFKTYVKKNTDEETEEKAKKNKRTFGGLYLKLKLQISPSQLILF